jgi:nitrogen-specific signal transduction histidine kinase
VPADTLRDAVQTAYSHTPRAVCLPAGLPMDSPGTIFVAFVTTKPQGTGMRLAITRSIVDAHGGRVWASANFGPGATCFFTLLADAAEHPPSRSL